MTIGNLGYFGIGANDLPAWKEFGEKILGLELAEEADDRLRFRADSQAWRISVDKSTDDDIAYLGFEVSDRDALVKIERRIVAAGVAVGKGDPELLHDRGVVDMITCHDPEGLRLEIYYGATHRFEKPFISKSVTCGFLAGQEGIGHVFLGASDIAAVRDFYCDVLGFKLSDIIVRRNSTRQIELEFYHCNERHHTLGLAPVRGAKRLNHFMLEVGSLDDVGFALDRAKVNEVPVMLALGKHTNDHVVSFYIQTPSGFDVEYGFGGRKIDDGSWRVVRHESTSSWGHQRLIGKSI